MIAKGATTIVNFYAQTNAGLPATGQASNISPSISINGATVSAISATISEKDSTNLPGWYEFEYTFNTAGNAFITFSCTGCIIMPWEEQVVEISTSSVPSASDIANAVWTKDIDSYSYNTTPGMAYKYLKGVDLLLTNVSFAINDIPADVWNYSSGRTITNTIPSASTIANEVWSKTITNYNTTGQAGYVLRNTGALVWEYAGSRLVTNTIPTTEQIASSVWGAQYRELTSDLATSSALSAVASNVSAVKAKTDNLPASPAAVGSAMTLTSAYDAAKTASQLTLTDLPSDYAKPGDAMTLTSAYDAAKTASQLTSADLPSDYAKPGDAMTLTSTYDAAKTAAQAGDAMTLTSAYDAAKTASQLTSADLSGLSTFDPTNDTVLIDATQAATMTTATGFATPANITTAQQAIIAAIPAIPMDYAKSTDIPDISGLATSANVSTAQSAIIAAIPAIPQDYAKTTDIPDISGLSTFNPATDTVQLDSTQLDTLATGSDVSDAKDDIIEALADIDIDTSDLAKATDVAVIADMIKQVDAGVLHWSTTATHLTLYKEDNTVLRVYSLERDIDGNITRISPVNA